MKIALSLISGSGDSIEEFLKRVDDDFRPMSSLPSNSSTIMQVLNLTKAIMDQVSQVVHLSKLNLLLVNLLIEMTRYTQYFRHRGRFFPVFTR